MKIDPKDIVFEERVKLKCFYCNKYNKNGHVLLKFRRWLTKQLLKVNIQMQLY